MATSDLPGELEQTKRRQTGAAPTAPAPSSGGLPLARTAAAPVGVMLTPEQIKAQADAEWRRGSQQRQAEFRQGVGNALSQTARSVAGAAMMPVDFIKNTTFDSNLPDYSTPAKEAARPGPTPQQQAGGIAAFDMTQRAVDAGLKRPISGVMRPSAGLHTVEPLASVASGQARRASGTASGGAQGGQPTPASPAQPGGLGSWSRIGIGAGRAGGEIAGRIGENGVPEFSNREADVKGAGSQRAVGSVGDGIGGGISYGEAGDSQRAIERFERANVERARMVESSRRGGIGEYGGLRIGGGDSRMEEAAERRRMSIAGLSPKQQQAALLEKAGQRLKADELGLRGAELRQRGIDAGLDRGLREREMAGAEQANALQARRTEQEIETGNLALEQGRRLNDLQQQYLAANDEQRPAIAAQIRALSGKDDSSMAPRDYIVKRKVPVLDEKGYPVSEKEELVDGRTGEVLGGGASGQGGGRAARTSVSMAEVEQTARNRGISADEVVEQLKQRGVSVNG